MYLFVVSLMHAVCIIMHIVYIINNVHICTHRCMHIHTFICTHAYTDVCTHTSICICMSTYICVYVYAVLYTQGVQEDAEAWR